jgi:MFS family permease
MQSESNVRLGLRENIGQFSLLVLINAFVGGMVGLERTILPLLAEKEFGLASKTAILSFIISFGLTKAVTNLFAGVLSDRVGRKTLLVFGWIAGLPVPFLLIIAPSWSWVVAANILLGVNQGLCWSIAVVMKIDLVGPSKRGLAMGLNEFAGYIAVAVAALASGWIAAEFGLRPYPFYLGIGFASLGLLLSLLFVMDTDKHVAAEARNSSPAIRKGIREIFATVSWKSKTLFSCSQAGMINNLNDGMVWGLLPIYFASFGLTVSKIGQLAAIYPAVWGFLQLVTGPMSDRFGRKWMIVTGMWVQAVGIILIALWETNFAWIAGLVLLGIGTAQVYPTLIAAVSDVAHPTWRASAVGVYRFWRDAGYAVGAVASGLIADLFGIIPSIFSIGALTGISGIIAAIYMVETRVRKQEEFE